MTRLRYCPHLPLPAYRYIPGKGPKDEKRDDLPKIKIENLPANRWKENEAYLYGIDLYQLGFFYEAHEVWEALWHKVGRMSAQGKFLKALIQLAAVQLKLQMGEEKPSRRLLSSLGTILETLLPSIASSRWMGVELRGLLAQCRENSFDKIRRIRIELEE